MNGNKSKLNENMPLLIASVVVIVILALIAFNSSKPAEQSNPVNTPDIKTAQSSQPVEKTKPDPSISTEPIDPGFSVSYSPDSNTLNVSLDADSSDDSLDGDIEIVAMEDNSDTSKDKPLLRSEFKNLKIATHTMKKGDTLWEIAKKILGDYYQYKVLKKDNNIVNHYRIAIGTKVNIKVRVREYTLKQGDTILDFAENVLNNPSLAGEIADFNMVDSVKEIFLSEKKIYIPEHMLK